jgi:hypothetical protein
MRQKTLGLAAEKLGRTKQANKAATATGRNAKEWSLKLTVRLPHKIGQPLGSGGSSDAGS